MNQEEVDKYNEYMKVKEKFWGLSKKGSMAEETVTEYLTLRDTPFNRVLVELAELHARKAADYARPEDPYINFRLSSDQVQQSPMISVEVLIATKQARLRELMWTPNKTAQNESVEDTLRDRIVFSTLALLMWREGLA